MLLSFDEQIISPVYLDDTASLSHPFFTKRITLPLPSVYHITLKMFSTN